MRRNLLRIGVLAEMVAILSSDHAAPETTALWLVLAAVTYWLIARGVRIAHAAELVLAVLGVVVMTVGAPWSAVAYAVEATGLVWLWHLEPASARPQTNPCPHAPTRKEPDMDKISTGSLGDRIAAVVAAVVHVGIAIFPLAATGLLAPRWFIILTGLAWTAGAVTIWHLSSRAPRWTIAVPITVLAAWALGIAIGGWLLGWTA